MGAIFGTGRSGTTWLGSIVDAHPKVLYRFEPLHVLKKNRRIAEIRRLLREPATSEQQARASVAELAQVLARPDLRIERPPFFPKESGHTRGRTLLNRAGRRLPLVRALYRALYPTPTTACLVFKEVSLEHELCALAQTGTIPIVYLIRHPAAFVASMKSGITKGVMNDKRAEIALDLAKDRAPTIYEKWHPHADQLTLEQRLTIAWAADTNLALQTTLKCPSVLHLVYEDLCRDTAKHASEVYDHFGLDMCDQSRTFISRFSESGSKEIGVDPYFSVFRDPRSAMNSWKSKLEPQSLAQVREIYEQSIAASHFDHAWDWSLSDKIKSPVSATGPSVLSDEAPDPGARELS